ncbi:proline dehydrogenase family protein [Halorarius halobius]|uniref:proline dehydrogenase family protein n=1 Tax=Halorarius halobius TaxID=2962671 RepID=UPI0020CFB169|nr:proline dehydrogenase family protein [Halorarius halobius]
MIPPVANNFVAGEDAPAALDHVRELNADGVGAILNLLGEHYDDPAKAADDAAAYCDLVDDIADAGVDACISVKPSQLGIDVGEDVFRENLADVVARAEVRGVFVWLDMEDHTTTDATLDAFEHHVTDHAAMGVCVQANLRRTREDLERLVELPGTVRLVKGAYDPPKEVAYRGKATVNERYREELEYLFEHADHVAVGSHDPEMVGYALDLHDEYGTEFEIQMLMGVREEAQFQLAEAGYDVNQYVPYGDKWLSYFYRRVRERKENALFALRAILG